MALPKPRPGLVIGYDFLFREQANAGLENAAKPHPAAIILVTHQARVSLVAISHSPPGPDEAPYRLKLTSAECKEMGLDTRDHWINLRDINAFDWPGYDLARSAPGGKYVYGMMSKGTFIRLVNALKACAGRRLIPSE
ncbi:hypothetical protein [Thalassospira mesophila]|uniref:hypothetical protein n=1 Tax=Thalassospira mesophila TaxID=1293891 RepID=UPI001180AF4D|nr:hypothetical protein [Thalassospira mesophila]